MSRKNPLSILLGNILQDLRRKESMSVDDIVKQIGGGLSAYRMIESGFSNVNINKVIKLISISCFQKIEYSKLSSYLAGVQWLETNNASKKEMVDAILKLYACDEEMGLLFGLHKIESSKKKREFLNYILDDRSYQILDYFNRTEVKEQGYKYLSEKQSSDLLSLGELIKSIESETLCVLYPLLQDKIDKYKQQISEHNLMQIEKELLLLEKEIMTYKEVESVYLYQTGNRWRNKKKFIEIYGIFREYDNLVNDDILEKFKDNISQLWLNPKFKNLTYIVVCQSFEINKDLIFNTFKKFIIKLQSIFPREDVINFKSVLDKLDFCIINENIPQLKLMNIDNIDNELWLYLDDNNFKYSFITEKVDSSGKISDYQYAIQSKRVTDNNWTLLDEVLRNSQYHSSGYGADHNGRKHNKSISFFDKYSVT